MNPTHHSLEFLVETTLIAMLAAAVPGVEWLHFENEATETSTGYGLVRLDRGEPLDSCLYQSELVLYIVGACDRDFRRIDEAITCKNELVRDLNARGEGFTSAEARGWSVTRAATDNNRYSRTYLTSIQVGYVTGAI